MVNFISEIKNQNEIDYATCWFFTTYFWNVVTKSTDNIKHTQDVTAKHWNKCKLWKKTDFVNTHY